MPLHDWNELTDGETVHTYWVGELGRWLKPRLPPGYRASLGTPPALAVAPVPVPPDVPVRRAVYVSRAGNVVAVIELISPRNKDRPETRRSTTDRFLGYL